MLQPRSMNSAASQSSSSGWVGLSPCVPKSSEVRTRPRPKNSCHMRLTATRAVSGLLRETIQRARPSRTRFAGRGRQRAERAGLHLVAALAEVA